MGEWRKLPFTFLLFTTSSLAYNLTILHTNDVHARFEEVDRNGRICTPQKAEAKQCFGGASRRMTKIKELKMAKHNNLLLDAGDQFQGTFWFNIYQGQAAAVIMKHLGYDVMALGNHEFDLGLPVLQRFINNVTESVEVVSANIDNQNEPGLRGYKNYTIRTVGGRKIGIIGYTTADTPQLLKPGNTGKLKFNDVVQSLRGSVAEIRRLHSDVSILIALGHAGFSKDMQIAKEVDGIDIVVGGHTNTFLYTGAVPSNESPAGEYPFVVDKTDGKKALCVQAFAFSKYLGYLEVEFDENGDIVRYQGNPILLDHTVRKDSETELLMAPLKEYVLTEGQKVISEATVVLNGTCRHNECNFGNLMADSFVYSNLESSGKRWSKASIALINSGNLRSSIPKGNITNADLLTAVPYGNLIISVTVTGRTLYEVFENSVSKYDNPDLNGRFLQVSGIHVLYNLNQPVGQRVTKLEALCLECDVPFYEPVRSQERYKVLTTSFMASGGDDYKMLRNQVIDKEDLEIVDVDMIINYLGALQKAYTPVDGRIQFLQGRASAISKAQIQNQLPLLIVFAAGLTAAF